MTKKSRNFKCIVLLFTTLLIFNLCGCSSLIDRLTTDEVPEQELVITLGPGCLTYDCSNIITVVMDSYIDGAFLHIGKGDDYCQYEILAGQFEKAAWKDYKVFILMNDIYYVFDIKEFEPPKDKNEEIKYELEEYTESEMKELYPHYESFYWYD